MVTISLCMIVKNEEAVLARCLDSVRRGVDEIVIVDTGSTDNTREIALRYTDRVLDFAWVDDFSAARNFAFRQATMEYQMWLDADDVLPEAELDKLMRLKEQLNPAVDMVTMKYHTHFSADGKPILTSTRERLMRRERGYLWQDPVHECVPLAGRLLHSDITVWHLKPHSEGGSTRNLAIYEKLEQSGTLMTPRQLYYYARELKDHQFYDRAAHAFQLFLDGGQGWVEDNIAACHSLAACHRALGNSELALPALLRSFTFAAPRAEICCDLGYHYRDMGLHKQALDWFSTAAGLEEPQSLGFVLRDYWGYIPNLECCVSCCHLGLYDRAAVYNERAKRFRADSWAVAHNERYLASIKEGKS